MTAPKPPAPIEIGPVRATVMKDRGQDGDQWYWRARRKVSRDPVWAGWATREEASAILTDRIARGLPPPSRPGSRGPVRVVSDLAEAWDAYNLQRVAVWEAGNPGGLSPRSRIAYRNGIAWWNGEIGDVLLARLSRAVIEDVILRWLAAGIAPRSVKHSRVCIGAMLKWGAGRGLCREIDLSRLSVPVDEDHYVNYSYTPAPHEVATLLADLPPIGQDLPDVTRLLAWTGARVGEIEAARVGDVDLEARTLRLSGRDPSRARKGKTGVRVFPLEHELLALLRPHVVGRDAADRLFALPENLSDQVNDLLAERCAALELPRWTCHAMRRMFDMHALDHGMSIKKLSKLTGQSPMTIIRHYVRPTEESVREELARVDIIRATTSKRGKVVNLRRRAQKPGTDDDDPV